MSVLFYNLIEDGVSVDKEGNRNRTLKYHVACSLGDSAAVALAAIPVTRYVTTHPSDPAAVATEAEVSYVNGSATSYEITYKFSTEQLDNEDKGATEAESPADSDKGATEPDERPPIYRYSSNKFTKPAPPFDLDNKPVTNTAYQPIELEIPDTNRIITISFYKNMMFDAFTKSDTYENTVNASSWGGYPAKSLRCNSYTYETVWEKQAYFYKVDIELERNKQLWNPTKVLNTGTMQILDHAKPPQPIVVGGSEITTPVPLDLDGRPLASGSDPIDLSFRFYVETNFSDLMS